MSFIKKYAVVASLALASFMPVLVHAQTAAVPGDLELQPIGEAASLGQSPLDVGTIFAAMGAIFLIALIPIIAIYIYLVVCMIYIAKKTNTPNGWLTIIPFVIPFKLSKFAGMSYWWGLLSFLPILSFGNRPLYAIFMLVTVAIGIYWWVRICERLGQPKFLGLLMIVPVANLVLMGYLAFSNSTSTPTQTPATV